MIWGPKSKEATAISKEGGFYVKKFPTCELTTTFRAPFYTVYVMGRIKILKKYINFVTN